MKKNKLSVVISAYNEESKIEDCLKSVSFANEIVLIDGNSIDKTVAIAKKYTSKIFSQSNKLMLNINKNFGFAKATGEWILSLDADERITPALQKEIEESLDKKSDVNGYWVSRKNIIFGKWIQHAGWYPDFQLRLFKRGKGKFPEHHVHEMIDIEGETDYLTEPMIHYNYETVSQFIQKLDRIYAPNEAEQLLKKGYIFDWTDVIGMPTREFVSRFFARQGYKDGFHGLILSMLMAFYHLVVFAKMWEKEGFKEVNNEHFLAKTEREFKKVHKEFTFWFISEKIKTARNSLNKFWLKVKSKFI